MDWFLYDRGFCRERDEYPYQSDRNLFEYYLVAFVLLTLVLSIQAKMFTR